MNNFYLLLRKNNFLNESLVHYGILLQNNLINIIKPFNNEKDFHFVITEGIVCHPDISKKIRETPNIEIYKNNQLVIKKRTDDFNPIVIYDDQQMVLDLYIESEKQIISSIINFWENNKKFYINNTEIINDLPKNKDIAGLASGYMTAELSYCNKSSNIVFFDYSELSLSFQKELISSKNRKRTIRKILDYSIFGNRDATIADLDQINYNKINTIYDYLKDQNVKFLKIDLRNINDIHTLISHIDNNSSLWISNVFHYITSLNDYNFDRYILLDNLCKDKNIEILPYTRIYYES